MRGERKVSPKPSSCMYTLIHISTVDVTLLSETGVGTMLDHHLKMLSQHRANYNKQDTVLAQLLYHLNTAHTNVVVSRDETRTLVHHLQMLNNLCLAIRTNHWLNTGSMLLVCLRNNTLAQHWVNAYNSSLIYIY